ncbi:hypothetical protein DFJ74DRAFT_195183 [Hyaloraphidium curvatum]|nr:hypothetical protein DFJ74DRAFT_195183 [Hyaloraphidium curvatum]
MVPFHGARCRRHLIHRGVDGGNRRAGLVDHVLERRISMAADQEWSPPATRCDACACHCPLVPRPGIPFCRRRGFQVRTTLFRGRSSRFAERPRQTGPFEHRPTRPILQKRVLGPPSSHDRRLRPRHLRVHRLDVPRHRNPLHQSHLPVLAPPLGLLPPARGKPQRGIGPRARALRPHACPRLCEHQQDERGEQGDKGKGERDARGDAAGGLAHGWEGRGRRRRCRGRGGHAGAGQGGCRGSAADPTAAQPSAGGVRRKGRCDGDKSRATRGVTRVYERSELAGGGGPAYMRRGRGARRRKDSVARDPRAIFRRPLPEPLSDPKSQIDKDQQVQMHRHGCPAAPVAPDGCSGAQGVTQ